MAGGEGALLFERGMEGDARMDVLPPHLEPDRMEQYSARAAHQAVRAVVTDAEGIRHEQKHRLIRGDLAPDGDADRANTYGMGV